MRRSSGRWVARMAVVFCLWLLPCGIANAEEGHPGLGLSVGLSGAPGAGGGVSILVDLTPAIQGSRGLPPLHSLRLVGDIGSLNLRGVPTCKPTSGSSGTSGCAAPSIGGGQSYAYQSPSPQAEGDLTLKLRGTVLLYSGGQQGGVSKLYAWASFPTAGPQEAGRSYVIPMTFTRKGRGLGELRATFPRTEGNRLSIAQLLLSIHQTVTVDRRAIPLTDVRCPVNAAAEVMAQVSFWAQPSATPIGATTSPTCGA
jgi:hypothetical protein